MTAITQHPDLTELRGLLAKAAFTRLHADEIGEDPEGVQDAGWRIHDLPDEPNKQGVPMAYWLAGGLDEGQAKVIVAAVNALPGLLDHIDRLTEDNVRLRRALRSIATPGHGAALDWSDAECSDYWARKCNSNRDLARQALTPAASEGMRAAPTFATGERK